MALILRRLRGSPPQDAAELRAEYAGAEVLMIGASRFNQAGGQPTFSAQTITGVDSGGPYFGASATAGGVITLPSSAAMRDGNCSGVAQFRFPAVAANYIVASNCYDYTAASADPGWCVQVEATGSIQLRLHETAVMAQSATGKVVAGRLHTVAWSYNRTSGAAAIAIDGTLYTATSVQATQTTRTAIGIGGYYDTNTTVGAGEKRFYLHAVWPMPRPAAEVLALSSQPLRIFQHQRIYIPGAMAGSAPTLSAATYAALTSTTVRPRVTVTF